MAELALSLKELVRLKIDEKWSRGCASPKVMNEQRHGHSVFHVQQQQIPINRLIKMEQLLSSTTPRCDGAHEQVVRTFCF